MPSELAATGSSAGADAQAITFGTVVLVRFPFTSQTGSKQRPAVIVSSQVYGLERPDLILMPVTSQLRPAPALGEVWVQHWKDAGLIKPSAVKPIFATLERGLVIRRLGDLSVDDQEALRESISIVLG